MTLALDRRLHVFRDDLAEAALAGRVEAARFAEGEAGFVAAPVLDIRPRPDLASGIDTQALAGEAVTVFETRDGWSWLRLETDGYVGYARADGVAMERFAPTHWVAAPRSFVYPGADMKRPALAALSMGSRVEIAGEETVRGTRYAIRRDGTALVAGHLAPLGRATGDRLCVAARFLETPYLWGGRSGFGLDCSALVQLSMMMEGVAVPRDSDMQEAEIGRVVDGTEREPGDLVFWKGHVALVEDGGTLLHANGATMSVAREPFDAAVRRIEPFYGLPRLFRRPA